MKGKYVIHYGFCDLGNESQMHDDWTDPICGTIGEGHITDKEKFVTCKKCIKSHEILP